MQPDITDVTVRCTKLIGDYERAENNIKGILADVPQATARRRRQMIARVNIVLQHLGFHRDPKVAGLIKLSYARGLHLVNPKLRINDEGEMEVEIFKDSLASRLTIAESAAASNVRDTIKRAVLGSVARELKTGACGLPDFSRVVALLDRRGARWDLSAYARVAVLTVAHEALTEGTLMGMRLKELDIIHVSEQEPVSNACKPFNNKIFSLSGMNGPMITKFPPFHPACGHFVYPEAA